MRWSVKTYPRNGTERTRRKFAFWRVKIGNQWVWLEFYRVVERYSRSGDIWYWAEIDRDVIDPE